MGLDKVVMFVKSIDRKERMTIRVQLEDVDCANGLNEDWDKVGSVEYECIMAVFTLSLRQSRFRLYL